MNGLNSSLPATDDQRSRPRESMIEKIADVAYDTLRKHEGPWQSDGGSDSEGSD